MHTHTNRLVFAPQVLEIGLNAIEIAQDRSGDDELSPCSLHMQDMYTEEGLKLVAKADFIFAYATCFQTVDGLGACMFMCVSVYVCVYVCMYVYSYCVCHWVTDLVYLCSFVSIYA